MDFLKAILGEELFQQFAEKINAYNGNEANKENPIKLANLASGEYVGKGKHDALQALYDAQKGELETANGLISDLKKGTKGNEEMQSKINKYETETIPNMQKQIQEIKISSALKVALLAEKALDVPYLSFKVSEKLKEDGRSLELDENENIKGWNDLLSGLKTQFPNQFETSKNNLQIEANPLPESDTHKPGVTQEQFNRMGYQNRLKLKQEQPEVYAQLTGKTSE